MFKNILKFIVFCGATLMAPFTVHAEPLPGGTSAYDFSFETLDGEPLPLSRFRGKVILVVNTASRCGFTPQYEGLEKLYAAYKDKGLVVIGVPSNDFGRQEPGTAQEIKKFCTLNYGVTFPVTSKQPVTGDNAHPFYRWAPASLGFGSAPKWNFHKYLVDANGNIVDYFHSTTAPDSLKLHKTIERLLAGVKKQVSEL
jgi:glutathione peroxidase